MRADRSSDNLLATAEERTVNGNYQRLEDNNNNNNSRRSPASLSKTSANGGVLAQQLDRYFGISEKGSSIAVEVRSGCIAWMTMSYIMVVNPVILSKSDPHDTRLVEPVMTATALAAAIGSLYVGLVGNAPLGLMPGMGLNAYFSFGICHAMNVTWQQAMSCCFASGALLSFLALVGACQAVVRMVLSDHLKKAITVAIGLFQALIGFQVMGLVIGSADTLVTLGDVAWTNERLYLALVGLCMISMLLVGQRVHGALLLGIWAMAACSWVIGIRDPPEALVSWPKFDAALCLDFGAWSPDHPKFFSMLVGTAVLLFVALFDIAGVQYGLFGMAGLLENGTVPRSNHVFASAGLSTMAGALLGTSPVIIANESSAGIMEGSKTGLSACVVAVLFVLSAFITPVLGAIPQVATAVPLVLIGAFMMSPCRGIDWDDLRIAIPSFLTITVVPFTYSIHNGIIAGILMDLFLDCSPQAPKEEVSDVFDIEGSSMNNNRIPSPGLLFASPSGRKLHTPMERKFSTPHAVMNMGTMCHEEKVARARVLLTDLELPDPDHIVGNNNEDNEDAKREEALIKALNAYINHNYSL
eukprot:TRINITY_DN32197_c0_g1_i1.p1 TRINITY_DN32197_c0_g1~~TRINITY_DN32197_c0_g1_i1.p1  ORF type:complete len:584 (+),score=138.30 TRINITY_DN32197_c0_g1_i1:118-1869(+)